MCIPSVNTHYTRYGHPKRSWNKTFPQTTRETVQFVLYFLFKKLILTRLIYKTLLDEVNTLFARHIFNPHQRKSVNPAEVLSHIN